MLKQLVKETVEIPELIKKLACDKWDLEKKLLEENVGSECFPDKDSKEKAKENVLYTDRELEWLRHRQTSVVAIINLLASLIGNGKMEEAQIVLQTVLESRKEQSNKNETTDGNQTSKGREEKTGVFTIEDAEPGKTNGTVWGVAVNKNGKKLKVCCKNGNAQKMHDAVSKQVKIKYSPLGDGKIFAISIDML